MLSDIKSPLNGFDSRSDRKVSDWKTRKEKMLNWSTDKQWKKKKKQKRGLKIYELQWKALADQRLGEEGDKLLLLQSRFSRVWLSATPWMAAHQALPSLGFSRQEHWSGLPFPSTMHESEVAQSCPTLSDPMDCSLPGSSIHGIFQARVLQWGATAFSEGDRIEAIFEEYWPNICQNWWRPSTYRFQITEP